MKTETYYAIKIGDHRHTAYLMVREDGSSTPHLFLTREAARRFNATEIFNAPHKVVRVRIQAQ